MTTIFDNPLTGYRFVDTRRGDTLQVIAFRELGDATQWPLLIAYNKLVYPFITDDPDLVAPGVLLTGAQILVPAPVPVISSTTDPTKVFEIDIALDANGLLQADANGDLAVVAGVDNLAQALENRVETDNGELIWHPEYGTLVRQLLGAMNGPNAGLLAAQYDTAAVKLDPRVQDVDQSVVNISGDQADIQMEVIPIVGRSVQIATSL
jgi:phage baseplate assembly protein W